ncbi:hypothetical protein [Chitinophaga niabensis]|uniref:Uncharacterized protein n=1 Tax=Chitinophaga niabensis TaxID=536979 RepID=A0A1N6DQC9_9BACT|nr:hypothetical protein [Chitinophaga niabensis]SIN73009.1 hypothetical protein SAMN04488055_0993 [Chitinophaga niabensis]
MFAPRQSTSATSETGLSVARFFGGPTPSGGGTPSFFPAYPHPFEGLFEGAGEDIACLRGLFAEMSTRTWDYLHAAARDGNYLTTLSGLKYIPEDRSDAFGHCWIGCRGTQECGEEATAFYGEAYENAREVMRYVTLGIHDHNSYAEDVYNQRMGRQLAHDNPSGDAFALTYQALVAGQLHFHGHNTGNERGPRVYVCEDIRLGGQLYEVGWRIVPNEFMERF